MYPAKRRRDDTVDQYPRTRAPRGTLRARNRLICLRGLRRRDYSLRNRLPIWGWDIISPSSKPRLYSAQAPTCCLPSLVRWEVEVDRDRRPMKVPHRQTAMEVNHRSWHLHTSLNRCLCTRLGYLSREVPQMHNIRDRCTCWRIRLPISSRRGRWTQVGGWAWVRGCSCRSRLGYGRRRLGEEVNPLLFLFTFPLHCIYTRAPHSVYHPLSESVLDDYFPRILRIGFLVCIYINLWTARCAFVYEKWWSESLRRLECEERCGAEDVFPTDCVLYVDPCYLVAGARFRDPIDDHWCCDSSYCYRYL